MKFGLPVLLAVLLVGSVFGGMNTQGNNSSGTPDKKDPIYDAQAYASDTGVNINEALLRFQLQNIAGELDAELTAKEAKTFAGLWIEHTPEFRVVVQFTRNGEETIKPYLKRYPELASVVEVRTARTSLADLQRAQASVLSSVRALGMPVDSGINVRENRVELYVAKAGVNQFKDALQRKGLSLPDSVMVVPVEKLAEPAASIYGGLPLSTCTSGFSVKKGWIFTTKGITTAAHCPNSQSYSGNDLPFQSERIGGSYDIQWHTAPGYTVTNKIQWWSDGSTRDITAKKSRNNQVIGEYVCKYGMTTHYTCGTIVDKNFAPNYIEDPSPTFIRVSSTTTDLVEPGDSGGPWFLLNTAYGTTSGHIEPGNDAIYMAVNYIESGLGVSVMTSP
jgi:hypothetical protein